MTKTQILKLDIFCYVTVSGLFAMFQNEKYRGPIFSWDSFPKMASSHCESSVLVLHPVPKKQHAEAKAYVAKIAHEIAAYLVYRMGK